MNERVRKRHHKGFTLLEMIVVIMIGGIMSSLALPRFFATVEFSRSTEALSSLRVIRHALERCYLQRGGDYTGCDSFSTRLDIEDPSHSPNSHFSYSIGNLSASGYTITAARNTLDAGDGSSSIEVTQTAMGVTRSGTGDFDGIQ